MTASAPCRSVSLCQTYSASQPRRSFAMWKQSASQLEPGKTTIANFMSVPGQRRTVNVERCGASENLHVIAFDDGVGQELLGHTTRVLLDLRGVRPLDLQEEDLPGAHVLDRAVAQPRARRRDRRPAARRTASADCRFERCPQPPEIRCLSGHV